MEKTDGKNEYKRTHVEMKCNIDFMGVDDDDDDDGYFNLKISKKNNLIHFLAQQEINVCSQFYFSLFLFALFQSISNNISNIVAIPSSMKM